MSGWAPRGCGDGGGVVAAGSNAMADAEHEIEDAAMRTSPPAGSPWRTPDRAAPRRCPHAVPIFASGRPGRGGGPRSPERGDRARAWQRCRRARSPGGRVSPRRRADCHVRARARPRELRTLTRSRRGGRRRGSLRNAERVTEFETAGMSISCRAGVGRARWERSSLGNSGRPPAAVISVTASVVSSSAARQHLWATTPQG